MERVTTIMNGASTYCKKVFLQIVKFFFKVSQIILPLLFHPRASSILRMSKMIIAIISMITLLIIKIYKNKKMIIIISIKAFHTMV